MLQKKEDSKRREKARETEKVIIRERKERENKGRGREKERDCDLPWGFKEMSDRMVIMNGGKIVQAGAPQEVKSNPVNEFVRDFLN